jgi:hypothetical protein
LCTCNTVDLRSTFFKLLLPYYKLVVLHRLSRTYRYIIFSSKHESISYIPYELAIELTTHKVLTRSTLDYSRYTYNIRSFITGVEVYLLLSFRATIADLADLDRSQQNCKNVCARKSFSVFPLLASPQQDDCFSLVVKQSPFSVLSVHTVRFMS